MNFFNNQRIFIFLVLAFLCSALYSQKAPMKFGKVSKADLEMKVYPLDTTASAAILCDYGYYSEIDFSFTRNLRIKIFKKEGLKWADKTFPSNSKGDVKGITYNLENGEIVESKLKSESIYKENITDDLYNLRIAMPNVKEGSIIDMEFRYPSLPSEWRFQDEIPVRWSELVIEPSQYIEYRKNFTGFEKLSEADNRRWVAKDIPAFKSEPYMNSYTNYLTKYDIEVLRISIPQTESFSGIYRDYCTDWNTVIGKIMGSNYCGGTLKGCAFLNDIVKEIESKYNSPFDKLKAAHEAIKKAVKWNGYEALFTTIDGLAQPYNKKIGNSADINLMLAQLLRKLELDVNLVVLSTRSNGVLPLSPSMDKLNYVIAQVTIDKNKYYADATEEFLPVGMLPERCLNIRGRLVDIDGQKQYPVDLIPDKKYKEVIQQDLKIEADLSLTGKIIKAKYDYAALNFRKSYEKFNSQEEFLKDFENEHKGISVSNCELVNIDSIYLPVKEIYDVKIKNKISGAGNQLYINPLLYEIMESNPFKAEERLYPVDFVYPVEKLYTLKLSLPQGMQALELPKPLIMKMPDNSASIFYQTNKVGDFLQVTYKLQINKANYLSKDYDYLRSFFSELVKKHAEPIILQTL